MIDEKITYLNRRIEELEDKRVKLEQIGQNHTDEYGDLLIRLDELYRLWDIVGN